MRLLALRLVALGLAVLLATSDCKRSASPTASDAGDLSPAEQTAKPHTHLQIDALLGALGSSDPAVRGDAEKALRKVAQKGLRRDDGVALIRGTARAFPDSGSSLFSPRATILELVAQSPDPAYVAPTREVFDALDPAAKTAALELLSVVDTADAARAFVALVGRGLSESKGLVVSGFGFEQRHGYGDVLFPALLAYARGPAADGIARITLSYAKARALPVDLALYLGPMLETYRQLEARLVSLQRTADAGTGFLGTPDYEGPRAAMEVMLDLFGWSPAYDMATTDALRDALALRDPRLVCFAALSLLHRGAQVPPAAFDFAASSPDSRVPLFDGLTKSGHAAYFPAKWATEGALAEGVMVRWLEYPTELGAAPDAIELMAVVSDDPGRGLMDWFLFRFRTNDPGFEDRGWMAGVAGPFKRAEEPSTKDYGGTFSAFEAWSSKSPDEHVASIRRLTAEAAAERGGAGKR